MGEDRKDERTESKDDRQPPTGQLPGKNGKRRNKDARADQLAYLRKKSTLASNVANVLAALRREPEIAGAFGYDEMLCTEILLRPLFGDQSDFRPRPVTDIDVIAVQAWLQEFGFRQLGKDASHDAVSKHAREHPFHPLRDYLNGLRWDGTGRLSRWLGDYLGAAPSDYVEQVGTMFLIGMVARIFEPGCKHDSILVLEGGQGRLKSTACAVLAGPKYFSDTLPDISSKEASQHLRGKWVVELTELIAYSRAAINPFKAFLARRVEQYRPPWGRKEVYEPRQCVFVGTTNETCYLRDETGNRRFWPVTIGDVRLDDLHRDRDQLFAEAVALYRGGVPWWPERDFEVRTIAPEQDSRFDADIWEPLVGAFIDGKDRVTMQEIAAGVLGYELEVPASRFGESTPPRGTPINRLTPNETHRIARILTHLGWKQGRKNRERWWEPRGN